MVYDWEDKRDACYGMYVVEKKCLDEVMKYFKNELGFVPSKRAFQTQFKRWGFPSKQNPAHRDETLVARTRELWELNTTQKDMVRILRAEGYNVSERGMMRLRNKHRLLLRGTNMTKLVRGGRSTTPSDAPVDPETVPTHDVHSPAYDAGEAVSEGNHVKRGERVGELQKDSNEKGESKKRRRRTRGWGTQPADPAGPPRFPSETTLDASKTCLELDATSYLAIRAAFQAICHDEGIVKKTISGPEKWQAAKNKLIETHPHLTHVFRGAEQPRLDQVQLSLDVICMDVTKRMRTMERQMTLAEAKNLLGVNPEEGRRLRHALISILSTNGFVNKYQSENWEELKHQWMRETGLAQKIPATGTTEHENITRAIQIVCRDIMKRWREAHVNDKHGQRSARAADAWPNPAEEIVAATQHQTRDLANASYTSQRRHHINSTTTAHANETDDFQIDPSLLLAARDTSLMLQNPYVTSTLHH